MSSHWLVKQLFNCFIHYFLEFSYEFQSVSPSVDFRWTFFIFGIFLITCMIFRWLICCFSLPCFSSMVAWLSCHFMSLQWQVSQDLLLCFQWNFLHSSQSLFLCTWWSFLHPPFFHYIACNVLDAFCAWCFPSRLPYCPCIAAQCGCFPSKLPYCPRIASWCSSFSSKLPYCLTVLALLPDMVTPSSVFSCSWSSAMFLHVTTHLVIFIYMMLLMVIHQCNHCIWEYVQDLLLTLHWHTFQACFNVYRLVACLVFMEHSPKTCSS